MDPFTCCSWHRILGPEPRSWRAALQRKLISSIYLSTPPSPPTYVTETQWGFHRQGYCQAGMSAALAQDGKRLFVGAPGSWYWQGQIYSKDLITNDERKTRESPASEDDSFLGYSSAVGEFTGDTSMDVVVGMPEGTTLLEKVVVYSSLLRNLQNITGEQMGSYFGHSVCVSDVNGDG
ncbi:integrin alpha-PS2 [Caerostris extrusa]|uniref:Integrin alpha-PS2 n=1 Tax=Caerostris extrusa TaxID=172846 RepID=A0AAV4WNA5_CAEEX|nr:integrin alpha-PS2 [Caerostris extrusa]